MHVDNAIVGATSKPYVVETTPRMTMNFAAGIPHNHPQYFQDDRPEGIIAPATLPMAFFWQMTVRHKEFWDSSVLNENLISRLVHYSESLTVERPLVPHEKISVTGEVMALVPHRAGTHIVIRYRGESPEGELIFDEFTGGMMRGVTCDEGGVGLENLPPRLQIDEDTPIREVTLDIDPLAAHRYDACSDIHFPIHTSVAFANMVGLEEPILHGTCTLGLALREIIEQEGGSNPAAVRQVRAEFTDMVRLGHPIQIQILGEVDEGPWKRVHFQVLNDRGQKAIRNGSIALTD